MEERQSVTSLEVDATLDDEAQCFEVLSVPGDISTRVKLSREELDYQLIAKSFLAVLEKHLELLQELFKQEIDEVCLLPWRQ